ncbi:MAG TPA: type I methionyl aminopeptidase [Patescibacteria group bacterium]|nr:type I methionyl aminopeptidase [Patescibacteria group bacterium]
MIDYKTPEEIKIMQHGGKILADVLYHVMETIAPGMTELEVDKMAERMIRERGGEPGFMRVPGYKYTVCMSTNDVVVHGIPGSYVFQPGDLVGVDCGVFYKGFHTDMSQSIIVPGASRPESEKFLRVGKKALDESIQEAVIGNRIGHISKKIQNIVEGAGYSIVRSLIGHGVGRELHEEPEVPGYLAKPINETPLLQEGMTIAVEVIYNMGSREVVLDTDGWTIRTEDGALAGLYERTIAITKHGPLMLTK